jgi:hypothetical protein
MDVIMIPSIHQPIFPPPRHQALTLDEQYFVTHFSRRESVGKSQVPHF